MQPAQPNPTTAAPGLQPPRLLDRMREALRVRHYSIRTEDCYVDWALSQIVVQEGPGERG